MNYEEATKYLSRIGKIGSIMGLDTMRALCKELGNPERSLNIIHIAGTNGKGSTGAFIDAALRSAGYRVCRYLSPAVWEYEEIISCDGENISCDELAKYISEVKTASDALVKSGMAQPTRFETETAAAFLYCRSKNCGYAILETGMGGREDAVNVTEKSRVSVITSISLDHTAVLGNTIQEIAYEKAGIIKQGGSVVTAEQERDAMEVIERICHEKNAKLIKAKSCENIRGNVFDYDGMKDVSISLKGAFQMKNAALAIEVLKELGICEEHIRMGLKNTVWRGRFETICENPRIIIDGAHNEGAAKLLAKTLKDEFTGSRINMIIGVFADKDYDSIVKLTAPLAGRVFAITVPGARALPKEDLSDAIRKYNSNTESADIDFAVRECMKDKSAVTVAFGSLSYLKDVKKAVQNEKMRQDFK